MGSILSSTPSLGRHEPSHIRSEHEVHFNLTDTLDNFNDRHVNGAYQPEYVSTNKFKNGILTQGNNNKRTNEIVQTTSIPSTPFHRRLGVPPLRCRSRIPSCGGAAQRHSVYLHKSNCNELLCDGPRQPSTYYTTGSIRENRSSREIRSPQSGSYTAAIHGYMDKLSGVQNSVQYDSVNESHRMIHTVREKEIFPYYSCYRGSESTDPSKKPSRAEIRPNALSKPCISRRVRFEQRRQLSEPSTYLQHSNSYCSSLDHHHYQPVNSGQLINQLLTAPSLNDLHWCIVHAQDTHSDVFDVHSNNGYHSTGSVSSFRNKPDCPAHSYSASTSSSLIVPCECSQKCPGMSRQLSVSALPAHSAASFPQNSEMANTKPYAPNHLQIIASTSRPLSVNLHNQGKQKSLTSPSRLMNRYSYQENEYVSNYTKTIATSVRDAKPMKETSRYKNFTKSISCYALKFFHYQQARTGSKVYGKREAFDTTSSASNAQADLQNIPIPELCVTQQEKSQLDTTHPLTTFQPQQQPDLRVRRSMSTKTGISDSESLWHLKHHHLKQHHLCCSNQDSDIINYGDVNTDRMFQSDIHFHGADKLSSSPNILASNVTPYRTNISCGNHIFTVPRHFPVLLEPTPYWLARLSHERVAHTAVESVMTDIRRHILRASTNELLRCLANFIISRIRHGFSRQHARAVGFQSLQSTSIVKWIKSIDRALLEQGWSEVTFINPVHTIYLYMVLKEVIGTEVTSELELHTIVMACLYLSYSYMGNEISYPLKPFLVAEANQLLRYNQNSSKRLGENGKLHIGGYESAVRGKVIEQLRNRFWQYCLRIIYAKSADMLAINADPMFFTALFWELKSYTSIVPSYQMPCR